MSNHAPVLVFAYRRPEHLRNTLTSLMQCVGFLDSPVIVCCDGPRDASETDAVAATREVARTLLGARAEYIFSETNKGLSNSVIAGLQQTLQRFGRVIVVEDDLELAPDFLVFMNAALERYEDDAGVFQVSGYMVDMPALAAGRSALFLPWTVSWGWATWRRAWDRFDPSAQGWQALRSDRSLRRRFNLDGTYDYATMLERQVAGLQDSWAIRWYWSVFQARGVVLFPPVSLVRNTGFDGTGTHGRGVLRRFSSRLQPLGACPAQWPATHVPDGRKLAVVKQALWSQNGGWVAWTASRLRRLVMR